jgi:hypothetical protein
MQPMAMNMKRLSNHSSCAIALLALVSPVFAQDWVLTDYQRGLIARQSLGGQVLNVRDLQGNLQVSRAVQVPYLWSRGALLLPTPTNETYYVSRGPAPGEATLETVAAPASTLPTLMELDGLWYTVTTAGFVQLIFQLNEWSVAGGSFSNCRLSTGAPLPAPGAIRLRLGNGSGAQTITLSTDNTYIDWIASHDIIRFKSSTGNVICDGTVPDPLAPLEFKNGFEETVP